MLEKIKQLLSSEREGDLSTLLEETSIEDIVSVFEQLSDEEFLVAFDLLEAEKGAEVFKATTQHRQELVLNRFSDVEISDVAEEILDDDIIEVMDEIDTDIVHHLLLKADPEIRNEKIVEILEYIEEKKFSSLKPLLAEMQPIDIADVINELDDDKVPVVFRLLPKDLAAETFVEMDTENQRILIQSFSDKELRLIIADLYLDDTVDLIEEMPANVVSRILSLTSKDDRNTINEMLRYPKDTAGSIMTPECISLRANMTVAECFDKIRRQAIDKETVYTCYVTNNQKKLLGTVTVKDLLLHDYAEKVGDFMEDNYIYADTLMDKEEVAQLLSKYNLLAIPVVDQENLLVGIVTIDDALDVLTEEATEDISKMAAITSYDKPYLKTNIFRIFWSRIPWLMLLLLSATFTGIIINNYELTLQGALIACVPMLMGTGGNSGSQSSVTVIRGMSLGEVEQADFGRVLLKETLVGLISALTLALVCFAKLHLIDNLIFNSGYPISEIVIVSVSLALTVLLAKIIGATLPFLARLLHLDPAVVASPFITTIIDVITLLLLCATAGVILPMFI